MWHHVIGHVDALVVAFLFTIANLATLIPPFHGECGRRPVQTPNHFSNGPNIRTEAVLKPRHETHTGSSGLVYEYPSLFRRKHYRLFNQHVNSVIDQAKSGLEVLPCSVDDYRGTHVVICEKVINRRQNLERASGGSLVEDQALHRACVMSRHDQDFVEGKFHAGQHRHDDTAPPPSSDNGERRGPI